MNLPFLTGLIGSLICVMGAAWPEPKIAIHPVKSTKNWLLAIGGLAMLTYAILNYLQGGPIFFAILQTLVVIASILMLLDTPDKVDIPVITTGGLILIVWSLMLFDGYQTVIFVLGLCGIGLGYALKMGSLKRIVALTLGSALIAIFSYLGSDWIFFWLNVFFAIFSGYYVYKHAKQRN